ncbi:MAG: hypothetical protein RL417_2541 [Pseudomonadota bacterium]
MRRTFFRVGSDGPVRPYVFLLGDPGEGGQLVYSLGEDLGGAVLRHTVVVTLSVLVWGCSLGGTSFQSPRQGQGGSPTDLRSAGSIELTPRRDTVGETSSIEVLWEVPTEPIDGFIVRFGEAHEALTNERRLSLEDIERVEDRERGRLYRYVISDIPNAQRVFLSISAVKGAAESPPSKVFEIAPGVPE